MRFFLSFQLHISVFMRAIYAIYALLIASWRIHIHITRWAIKLILPLSLFLSQSLSHSFIHHCIRLNVQSLCDLHFIFNSLINYKATEPFYVLLLYNCIWIVGRCSVVYMKFYFNFRSQAECSSLFALHSAFIRSRIFISPDQFRLFTIPALSLHFAWDFRFYFVIKIRFNGFHCSRQF